MEVRERGDAYFPLQELLIPAPPPMPRGVELTVVAPTIVMTVSVGISIIVS